MSKRVPLITVADLAALEQRVHELERTVAQLLPTTPLAIEHVQLLEAIATTTYGRPFTSKAVFKFMSLTGHDDLRRALDAAGIETPKSLGWMLRRAWRRGAVQRHRKPGGGTLWQVVRRIS